MKQYFSIIYWLVVAGLTSLLFVSLMENYGSALFLAIMMLPGALFAKFFGDSISFKNRKRGILETIYLLSIILLIVYLSIFLACFYLYGNQIPETMNILFNPVFIWLLLLGFWKFEDVLAAKLSVDKVRDKFIEFTSERKKIKIEIEMIQYVESCDDFVLVVVSDGTQYRTKMNITSWSNILDNRFARVHRSYIVNKNYVKGMSAGRLELVSGAKIEVSKRYRDMIDEWFEIVD
jgi:hypothetical protein